MKASALESFIRSRVAPMASQILAHFTCSHLLNHDPELIQKANVRLEQRRDIIVYTEVFSPHLLKQRESLSVKAARCIGWSTPAVHRDGSSMLEAEFEEEKRD